MSTEPDRVGAVAPGVAVDRPAELAAEDEQIREQLDEAGLSDAERTPDEIDAERTPDEIDAERTPDEIDADIEREGRTVQPHSAAPSRSGIGGSGSGADEEGL